MLLYRYETHLHTAPVSKCAKAGVRETLEFYKEIGYAGVFITNHFLDGNINMDRALPYEQRIRFYFSDYEDALSLKEELGIDVFCGVELSYKGTDFLVYGLDKQWFLDHPEIEDMPKSQELSFMRDSGALVIQAHPFREAGYIDHIRLYPRHVHGIEICNATQSEFRNQMAAHYAQSYGLLGFGGSDNHVAAKRPSLAGMEFDTPLKSEKDFVARVLQGDTRIFAMSNPLLQTTE